MPGLLLVLATLLLLVPTVDAQPGAEDDYLAIAEAAAAFSAAFMQGDAETMAALYTEEAVIFPEGRPAIEGRAAIQAYWTLSESRTITNHHIMPASVEVVGDMAYDHGLYTVSGANNGEAWGPSYGKYLIVWKRSADGAWRMHLDMWNSTPAPETD